MADEITVTAALTVAKGGLSIPKLGSAQFTADMAGSKAGVPGAVSVATSQQDIDLSALSSMGWCRIENTDPTNYVDYGPKSGGVMVDFGRLLPGEATVFRFKPGVTLRMVANAAAVVVLITAAEA